MSVRGYNNDVLFSKANSEGLTTKTNSAPSTIDDDTENVTGGICSGITSSWMIALLNANKMQEARDTAKFPELYNNSLRFQGAYFKELHGTAEKHLPAAGVVAVVNGEPLVKIEKRNIATNDIPTLGWWACYVSMRGHAIGIGKYNKFFHIMDPNFGLFTYRDQMDFVADVNGLIDSYFGYKGYPITKKSIFHFYKRSSGAKG